MRLKDYQQAALVTVSNLDPAKPGFLQIMAAKLAEGDAERAELAALPEATRAKILAKLDLAADPLADAWTEARDTLGAQTDWHALIDGAGRPIPSICLKLPTGGGKTLLAAHVVERLQVDWLRAQTGLVLWIVPSQAIYAQTLAALKNRAHPIRQTLDRASAGRVRILQKDDRFTRMDVESCLCVLVLMLQSARRADETVLRMFRGNGDASFFPEEADKPANDALLASVPNLDRYDLGDSFQPGWPKRSLANVIRLLRPIAVVDEAHNAMTELGHQTLSTLNPRFILELTATPTPHSNVLVDVKGTALRDEEMIKLPINVAVDIRGQWQRTLQAALDQLNALETAARDHEQQSGRYIRPIMVVRVDYTGEKTRDQSIHVEEAVQWLAEHGGLDPARHIRRQTSEKKELGDEDLMSPLSEVRVVITKDALREGWDAPFAYVLAILSSAGSATALTQFIGRVLRQPYATRTHFETDRASLDEAYVFCTDKSVGEAVKRINKGLTAEGMGDLSSAIRTTKLGEDENAPMPRVPVTRAEPFKGRRILLPRVLRADGAADGGWRDLDYDADILGRVDWGALSWRGVDTFVTADDGARRAFRQVDLAEDGAVFDHETGLPALPTPDLDRYDLVRRLCETVPNPWQADRIVGEALAALQARGADDALLARCRLTLVDAVAGDLVEQIETAARTAFVAGVAAGDIVFRLTEPPLPMALNDAIAGDAGSLERVTRTPLQKALYAPVLRHEVNGFEAPVALYMDESEAVGWWWRVAARRDQVGLQGWRRHKVYPDFLVSLEPDGTTATLLMLETKGGHLAGNADTQFKSDLFEELTSAYDRALAVGQMSMFETPPEAVTFEILFDDQTGDAWRTRLAAVLTPAAT